MIPTENTLFDPTPDVYRDLHLTQSGEPQSLPADSEQALWLALLEETLAQNPSDIALADLTGRFPMNLEADLAATDEQNVANDTEIGPVDPGEKSDDDKDDDDELEDELDDDEDDELDDDDDDDDDEDDEDEDKDKDITKEG
jgi:hypothetical protein